MEMYIPGSLKMEKDLELEIFCKNLCFCNYIIVFFCDIGNHDDDSNGDQNSGNYCDHENKSDKNVWHCREVVYIRNLEIKNGLVMLARAVEKRNNVVS